MHATKLFDIKIFFFLHKINGYQKSSSMCVELSLTEILKKKKHEEIVTLIWGCIMLEVLWKFIASLWMIKLIWIWLWVTLLEGEGAWVWEQKNCVPSFD